MSLSLQEALRKLREAKQTEQAPVAKRPALSNEGQGGSGSNSNNRALESNVEAVTEPTAIDENGLDFDMDAEMDSMFDDLVPDASDLAELENGGEEASANIAIATGAGDGGNQQNGVPAGHTRVDVAKLGVINGIIGDESNRNSNTQTATGGGAGSQDRDLHAQQSQRNAAPIPAAPASRTRTVTTTLVRERSKQSSATTRKRQEIPGPAGTIGDTPNQQQQQNQQNQRGMDGVANAGTATQARPASMFKTPMSRTRTAHMDGAHTADADFEGGTWMAMLEHLGIEKYNPAVAKTVVRTVAMAEWPVRRVLDLTQSQKIRFMLVQLREIATADSDASAVVVDPTGEMKASIHWRVMGRFGEYLGAGTSLILKDVVALKLTSTRPFLIVTEETIEQIFTEKAAGAPSNPIAIPATQLTAPERDREDGGQEKRNNTESTTQDLSNGTDPQPGSPGDALSLEGDIFADDDGTDSIMDLLDPSSLDSL
ncbi:hypothetical protein H4217_002153 [Coemansia sp. RSA 1939]|nr:hypothetical protein H4217_002153 [Coemansia sp. RSA 1939]KAJ2607112.1 hypothetical protein EV177_005701 [Coemansia sp. RSA 1804]KAJ2691628.1 hypothetical protein GGH99_002279 [Coemansia sp. RSA 1285]